jgi:hypothetical protein
LPKGKSFGPVDPDVRDRGIDHLVLEIWCHENTVSRT